MERRMAKRDLTPSKLLFLVAINLIQLSGCFVNGFALVIGEEKSTKSRSSTSIVSSRSSGSSTRSASLVPLYSQQGDSPPWMTEGFLISSFTDGLKNNKEAQDILRLGLEKAIHQQAIAETERELANSVRASPCNGPNIQLLEQLEDLEKGMQRNDATSSSSRQRLRVLFIPTAMYALRLDSTRTPGQQRQRARADAKQRRDEICTMLSRLLVDIDDIHAITVDLADGSVKQPEVWSTRRRRTSTSTAANDDDITTSPIVHREKLSSSDVPQTGREAINDWKPHLIYLQGGNTFWLHYCLRGYRDDLRHVLTSGGTFFCGASAGAIVAGTTVSTALWKGWDDPRVVPEPNDWEHNNQHDPIQTAGLSLLGPHYSCFPHYDTTWESTVADKTYALREIDPFHQVMTIADDQVVHVDGRRQSIHMIFSPSA
jgi:peptidase E